MNTHGFTGLTVHEDFFYIHLASRYIGGRRERMVELYSLDTHKKDMCDKFLDEEVVVLPKEFL